MDVMLPYSREEALSRMERVTGRLRMSDAALRDERPLVGRLSPDGFSVRWNGSYTNNFGAVCRGRLSDTAAGCRLEVELSPSLTSRVFVIGWFIALLLYAAWIGRHATGVRAFLASNEGTGFLLMLGGGVAVASLGFGLARYEARQIQGVLTRTLALRAGETHT